MHPQRCSEAEGPVPEGCDDKHTSAFDSKRNCVFLKPAPRKALGLKNEGLLGDHLVSVGASGQQFSLLQP